MNLQELITTVEEICLSHKQISSFQVGNNFDIANTKSERYPCVWFETPILIEYPDNRMKTFSTALNFLSLVKSDDLLDVISKTSDMEVVCDEVLQAIRDKSMKIGSINTAGLTLKNFSDDDLVGVRCDLTFLVGRQCDYEDSFDKPI